LHAAHRYDLILLDLHMPEVDGFEVMEGQKEIETGGYLPVLVIKAQPGHKLRALRVGAKDFVSKPFDLVEVQTRIHNMLEVRLLYKKLDGYNRNGCHGWSGSHSVFRKLERDRESGAGCPYRSPPPFHRSRVQPPNRGRRNPILAGERRADVRLRQPLHRV
jgi:DNA-binding response OmpR family regulator